VASFPNQRRVVCMRFGDWPMRGAHYLIHSIGPAPNPFPGGGRFSAWPGLVRISFTTDTAATLRRSDTMGLI
jgi:hypothetical protein